MHQCLNSPSNDVAYMGVNSKIAENPSSTKIEYITKIGIALYISPNEWNIT